MECVRMARGVDDGDGVPRWRSASGLLLLFAVSMATTAGLLAYHLGKWLDWPRQALFVWLALCCMTASLLARPHLLALPLLEVWAAELVFARSEKRAPSLALLPVMSLWVNLHGGGFVVGLALTAAASAAIEALITDKDRAEMRNWGIFLGGAVAAALINPHFVRGLLFPIIFMGVSSLGNIGEWRPIDFSFPQPLELVAMGTIYYIVTRGVKIPRLRALMVLALLHLAFQHQRHQIVFGVLAPLLLAEPLSIGLTTAPLSDTRHSHLMSRLAAGASALIIGLAMIRVLVPVRRSDSPVAPITALGRVPLTLRAEHVLNDYSFGGYLIFSGVRTFVDSRAELYGDVFLRQCPDHPSRSRSREARDPSQRHPLVDPESAHSHGGGDGFDAGLASVVYGRQRRRSCAGRVAAIVSVLCHAVARPAVERTGDIATTRVMASPTPLAARRRTGPKIVVAGLMEMGTRSAATTGSVHRKRRRSGRATRTVAIPANRIAE